MPFKALLDSWADAKSPELSEERYSVRLPMEDAARIEALTELFPGTSVDQVVADLLHTGLDALQAAMPYVAGDKVIREDEFGDPVYEDVGLTPRFLQLARQQQKAGDS